MAIQNTTPKPAPYVDWDEDAFSGTVRVSGRRGRRSDRETARTQVWRRDLPRDETAVARFEIDAHTGVVSRVSRREVDQLSPAPEAPSGVLNRFDFVKRLKIEVALTRSSEVGLLLIDIDYFGQVKTHYGLEEAVRLISELQPLCQHQSTPRSYLGRYDRCSLAMLFTENSRAEVQRVAGRIITSARAEIAIAAGCPMTLSMGCAFSREAEHLPGGLIELAEQRLDEAIESGGDRLVMSGVFQR